MSAPPAPTQSTTSPGPVTGPRDKMGNQQPLANSPPYLFLHCPPPPTHTHIIYIWRLQFFQSGFYGTLC